MDNVTNSKEFSPKNKVHPLAWVSTLYSAESLPYNVATVVIMLYFKDKNLTTTQIAFWSSLIGLPWMLKPFWAPFLERVKAKKRIVIATQFFTAFMFGCIAFAFTTTLWYQLSIIFLFVLAFIAATHDIAADGV